MDAAIFEAGLKWLQKDLIARPPWAADAVNAQGPRMHK